MLVKIFSGIKRLFYRDPDFYIGGWETPYIRRWWVIPRNRFFNIYLHNQLRDDEDRALHTHPWFNISIVLRGGYIEIFPVEPSLYPYDQRLTFKHRKPGHVVFRVPSNAHRLELRDNKGSWSLFITGPKIREWGFWCMDRKFGNHKFVPWQEFTDPTDYGKTGRGCE